MFKHPTVAGVHQPLQGKPWCHIFFCSDRKNQNVSATLFDSIGLQDGQTIKLYHGTHHGDITIKDKCFSQGWNSFCTENLIHEVDMIFLRTKQPQGYDVLTFSHSQSHILMPWTLPLPMLSINDAVLQQPKLGPFLSSINPFLKHDWTTFNCFYQFYLPKYRYKLLLPEFANPLMHERTHPTIALTVGERQYHIGRTERTFDHNWSHFVNDHDL